MPPFHREDDSRMAKSRWNGGRNYIKSIVRARAHTRGRLLVFHHRPTGRMRGKMMAGPGSGLDDKSDLEGLAMALAGSGLHDPAGEGLQRVAGPVSGLATAVDRLAAAIENAGRTTGG